MRVSPNPRPRRGFTLIEAAIVTAIVGLGIVGMLQLIAAGSMANGDAAELTTAIYLANNVGEMIQGTPYDALKATYDNDTYSPPVDARGVALSGFSGWSQVIDVQYVDPDLLTSAVPDTQVEVTSRVTVSVLHNSKVVYSTKWIMAAPQ